MLIPLAVILLAMASNASTAPQTDTRPAPEVAFTIKEKDLIPEGIAWDPTTSTMYVSSLHKDKIISIAADGTAKDFTSSRQDGLWNVFGLRVDPERRVLWAMSAGEHRMKKEKGLSGVFKYDLATGKLIRKYLPTDDIRNHMFNDGVVSPRGDLYLTDTLAGAVHWIPIDKDELLPFLAVGTIQYPNGITISPDGRSLFVAHSLGISVIDTSTRDIRDIRTLEGVPLLGIDGLYFHKGGLVAIQSGRKLERVMRFQLNATFDRVEGAETLDAANPLFNTPTTGAVVGDTFYYLANSQMDSYTPEGRIFPPDKLEETWILKVVLR